jgi:hypothetical protein
VLKQAIPGNPNIMSVEEIEAAITIFTSTIKSTKTPRNCFTHTRLETRPLQILCKYHEEKTSKEKHA